MAKAKHDQLTVLQAAKLLVETDLAWEDISEQTKIPVATLRDIASKRRYDVPFTVEQMTKVRQPKQPITFDALSEAFNGFRPT